MTSEPGTQSSVEIAGGPAPAPVISDPEIEDLKARAANGEKLSPQQWGKLGAFAKRVKGLFTRGGAPAQPALAGNGNPLDLVSSAPAEGSGDDLPTPPDNPGRVQRTTAAILSRLEKYDKRKTIAAAKLADPLANDKEMARVERSAALPVDDKELLVELSPDALAELRELTGFDLSKTSLGIFAFVFITWRMEQRLAIQEFLQAAKEREAKAAAALKRPPAPEMAT